MRRGKACAGGALRRSWCTGRAVDARLVALVPYGGGLHLLEALCLRVQVEDVDLDTGELLVCGGTADSDG